MASISKYVICPKCGEPGTYQMSIDSSGEMDTMCMKCGYTYTRSIVDLKENKDIASLVKDALDTDDYSTIIKRCAIPDTDTEKCREYLTKCLQNEIPLFVEHDFGGHGTYSINFKDGSSQMGSFAEFKSRENVNYPSLINVSLTR